MTLVQLLVLLVVPAAVVLGLWLKVGRRWSREDAEMDPDLIGFVGGILNATFVVVLAFYIVFAWQRGDDISSQADREANAVIDVYHQAQLIPGSPGTEVQALAATYAREVVDVEWEALAEDGEAGPAVQETIDRLRSLVSAWPTDTESTKTARQLALADVRVLDEVHRERVDDSTGSDPLTSTLLIGIGIGAVLVLAYPLLIGLSRRRRHITALGGLGVVLGVTMFVALSMRDPLNGPFSVDPEAFEAALRVVGSS
ncbi:MAG: bestrophin-like domain [Sporichthyaceae bacterium]